MRKSPVSKAMRALQMQARTVENKEGVQTVLVFSAGIGRMQFRATLIDDDQDRQDGEDRGTFETPGDALRHLADRLDRQLIKEGWEQRMRKDP